MAIKVAQLEQREDWALAALDREMAVALAGHAKPAPERAPQPAPGTDRLAQIDAWFPELKSLLPDQLGTRLHWKLDSLARHMNY